jgi:DNA-directed RNA polymerase specialized sigma24 family protein
MSYSNDSLRKLNNYIRSIYGQEPICSDRQILKTIARHLIHFRLNTIYEPKDVLNEVLLRAINKINSGDEIPNLLAWCRSTAFNVIREWSRKEQQHLKTQVKYEFNFDTYSKDLGLEVIERYDEYKKLSDTLKELNSVESELLISRASGKSWKEIAKEFIACENEIGDIDIVASRLAQQYSRLIKELRRDWVE